MKELQEHCADLSRIIAKLHLNGVSDWLMIAAGIEKIDFKWNRFDKSLASSFCRDEYENDRDKAKINQIYIQELTIFNYVWSAFENTCNIVFTNTQIKKYGKLNLALNGLSNDLPISGYKKLKSNFFHQLFIAVNQKFISFKKSKLNHELRAIYELRNNFAHGELRFLESEENDLFRNPMDMITLITISSRVILFYIQALISSSFKEVSVSIYFDEFFENCELAEIILEPYPIEYLMSRIHLKRVSQSG